MKLALEYEIQTGLVLVLEEDEAVNYVESFSDNGCIYTLVDIRVDECEVMNAASNAEAPPTAGD